jgi:hypothetical protein
MGRNAALWSGWLFCCYTGLSWVDYRRFCEAPADYLFTCSRTAVHSDANSLGEANLLDWRIDMEGCRAKKNLIPINRDSFYQTNSLLIKGWYFFSSQ